MRVPFPGAHAAPGDTADRTGARHRGEAAPDRFGGPGLGQGGEDGVLEFGRYRADRAGAFAAQPGGALTAEDAKGGQDSFARTGDAPGLLSGPG